MNALIIPKHASNVTLAVLGVIALVHSFLHFGTGALPEAILALLLFLNAFSNRKQPRIVVAIGIFAIVFTWLANSRVLGTDHVRTAVSWAGILLFATLGFSPFIFKQSHAGSASPPDIEDTSKIRK